MSENGSFLRMLIDNGVGYLWFVLLAAWGGTVSYINRLKKSHAPFRIVEWIGELSTAAFVGLLTAYLCKEMEASFYVSGVLVAITGHMGVRALFIMENWWKQKLGIPDK